jgi:hypothetical protein
VTVTAPALRRPLLARTEVAYRSWRGRRSAGLQACAGEVYQASAAGTLIEASATGAGRAGTGLARLLGLGLAAMGHLDGGMLAW